MSYNEDVPAVRLSDSDPAKKILSCKNYRWLYEREWRMFGTLGRVSYAKTQCIARVYLGSRMTDAHRNEITARLSNFDIPTHEMMIEKYSIGFEAI
jgi:hypothetical protein